MLKRLLVMCLVVCLSLMIVDQNVTGMAGAIEAELPLPIEKTAYPVNFGEASQIGPAVIYNSERNEYFVAWSEMCDIGLYDIWAARFDAATGEPIGAPLTVLAGLSDMVGIDGAYVASTDQYLLVWHEGTSTTDILGYLINYNGLKAGFNEFEIAASDIDFATNPTVAYDPNSQNFLVAWTTMPNTGVGTGIGSQIIPLSNPPSINASQWYTVAYEVGAHTHSMPDLAWDERNDLFAMVYQYAYDADDRDIYLAYFEGDGTQLALYESISIEFSDETHPVVASCSDQNSLFVAWEDDNSGDYSVVGNLRDAGYPTTPGHSFTIMTNTGIYYSRPDMACNEAGNAYMVSWWESDPVHGKYAATKLYHPDGESTDFFYVRVDAFDVHRDPYGTISVAGGKSSFGFAWEFYNTQHSVYNVGHNQVSPYAVYQPLSIREP